LMDILKPFFVECLLCIVAEEFSESLGLFILSIIWNSKLLETQCFRNWICFRPYAKGGIHLLGWVLGRANLNHWITTVIGPLIKVLSKGPLNHSITTLFGPVIEVSTF
jgi:hypothetical protein